MDNAVAVVIGAMISGVVGVLAVFYQQRLSRRHELDKARAARLSEFSAVGWAATLAISELARAPMSDKDAIEGSERFQAIKDGFNSALALIQLLDDGDVYTSAHHVNAYLTTLNRQARSVQIDRDTLRARHAELSELVAEYQRAARMALGSPSLPDTVAWLPRPGETDFPDTGDDAALPE